MTIAEIEGQRYLNAWAREQGYHDYDTYLAVGGKMSDTAKSMRAQMRRIAAAFGVLSSYGLPEPDEPTTDQETLQAGVITEADVDAIDPDNAHAQGA
jgi:hypothetical protein